MRDADETLHECPQNDTGEDILVKTYDGKWHIWDMVELSGPSFEITFCPFCGKGLGGNTTKPERVTTLERLMELAHEKRAITCNGYGLMGTRPAAFVVNLSGFIILRMFQAGMYVYQKKEQDHGSK